jgi:hypothetical protein
VIRKVPFLAALAVAAVAFGASAQAKNPTFTAVPVTAIEKTYDLSVGDTLWECAPGGCKTTSASGSAARTCAQAVKKFGKLEQFLVDGAAFEADKLATCNEKAS